MLLDSVLTGLLAGGLERAMSLPVAPAFNTVRQEYFAQNSTAGATIRPVRLMMAKAGDGRTVTASKTKAVIRMREQ